MSRLKNLTTSKARPLPVLVLADVSYSMLEYGKIDALNQALEEMIESFKHGVDLEAEIQVAVITFGNDEAKIHIDLRPVDRIAWAPLKANGNTPMGKALKLAKTLVEHPERFPRRAYRPVVILLSDGQPTDVGEWEAAMQAFVHEGRSKKVHRMAMAIGRDADERPLRLFIEGEEEDLFLAQDASRIREFFRMVSQTVLSLSQRTAGPNVVSSQTTTVDLDF